MYLDVVWMHVRRSGTTIHGEIEVSTTNLNHRPRTTEWLTSDSLSDVSRVSSCLTALQLQNEYATPPHIQKTSRYIIARDQFYQAFPILVLQATNAGVRRPGYEATHAHMYIISTPTNKIHTQIHTHTHLHSHRASSFTRS